MLTDYNRDPVVSCRHGWRFRCWYRDIGSGQNTLRWMLELCRRCGAVRITHYACRHKMRGYSYAENMAEALLGRPYAIRALEGVLQN